MTDRVSVPKRLLQRFHVQSSLPSRKRRGRRLFSRWGKDTEVSSLKESPKGELKTEEDSRLPASVPTPKRRRRVILRSDLPTQVPKSPTLSLVRKGDGFGGGRCCG
jgi:hypothetical protein